MTMSGTARAEARHLVRRERIFYKRIFYTIVGFYVSLSLMSWVRALPIQVMCDRLPRSQVV